MAQRQKNESTEVFEEVPHVPRRAAKGRAVKLYMAHDGSGIDYDRTNNSAVADVLEALTKDENTAQFLKQNASSKEDSSSLIDCDHVGGFLDAVEAVEQFLIPRLVARKMAKLAIKNNNPALANFRIDPDVAKKAFTFRNREKLVPLGVEAANANLPPNIKRLIAKVGPGSKFVGLFFLELRAQQKRAVEMQVEKYKEHAAKFHNRPSPQPPQPRANGHAAQAQPSEQEFPPSAVAEANANAEQIP